MIALINTVGKLFAATWDFFRALTVWWWDAVKWVIGEAFKIPSWFYLALSYLGAALVTVLTLTGDALVLIFDLITSIIGKGNGLADGGSYSGSFGAASSILAGINTFVPLDEGVAFLTVLMGTTLTAAGIRIAKSWLPTIG
jgi:hypothetical protein